MLYLANVTPFLQSISWQYLLAATAILLILSQSLAIKRLRRELRSIDSRSRSAEVRLGKFGEVFAPYLPEFPVDISKPGTSLAFLGQPVDFVFFDPEEGVTFIEVKTGGSALSSSQRAIRRAIEEGRVDWQEVRLLEKEPRAIKASKR